MLVVSCFPFIPEEINHLKCDVIHRKAQHGDPVLLWAYVKEGNFLGNTSS